LDWKGALPVRDQTEEFAKDIAAMANTRGGLLVYGVKEERGTGQADSITPVETNERARQRLSTLAYSHVHPVVGGLAVEALDAPDTPGQGILVVSVPASPDAPHVIGKYNGLGVPWRDGPDTRWMREREIERAYRDRFERRVDEQTRLADAAEELRERLDLEGKAWLVATAVPRTQLPTLLPQAAKETVTATFQPALERAVEITAPNQQRRWGVLNQFDQNAILNPRVGLHRWIVQTSLTGPNEQEKYLHVELHHDGAISLAQAVDGWDQRGGDTDGHRVPTALVESALADFVALVDTYATPLGTTGLYGLRADLIRPAADRPLIAVTQWTFSGLQLAAMEEVDWARRVRSFIPTLGELTAPAGLNELRDVARRLALDVLNQFNISRTNVLQVGE
jgi:hypothetical protein